MSRCGVVTRLSHERHNTRLSCCGHLAQPNTATRLRRRQMTDYMHHVPGRLRLRSTRIARHRDRAALEALLRSLRGVESARFKPASASLLIRYDAGILDPAAIVAFLTHAGYTPTATSRHSPRANVGTAVARQLTRHILATAVERLVVSLISAV